MYHIKLLFVASFNLWEWKTGQLYEEMELIYEAI